MTKILLSKHFALPVHFAVGKIYSPVVQLDNLGHRIIKELLHSEQVRVVTGNTIAL